MAVPLKGSKKGSTQKYTYRNLCCEDKQTVTNYLFSIINLFYKIL